MQMQQTIPRSLSLFGMGIAINVLLGFLAQTVIMLIYALFPSDSTWAAQFVSVITTTITGILILLGFWKKMGLVSAGIIVGMAIAFFMNFPFLLGK